MIKIIKSFLLISVLFLCGCIDEPNNVKLETINGVVYDDLAAPLPFIDVASDNFTIFQTSYGGRFLLGNVNIPYNVFLSTGNTFFTSYVGLKNRNPNLTTILGYYRPQYCFLTVRFPQHEQNRVLVLKFISDQFHEQDKYLFPYVQDSTWFIVKILPFEPIIRGKIIYLDGLGDYNSIYNFKKFGIKDVTIKFNQYNAVTFFPEDINYDPEEKYITIYSPGIGELEHFYSEAYLYIDNIYNEIKLDEQYYDNYSYFTVPVLPKLKYDIKINDVIRGSNWLQSVKWIHLQPGENATIIHDPCPEIISPDNNASGTTDTTLFTISDNNVPGIYQYSFWIMQDSAGSNFAYDIYTEKKIFTPRELLGDKFKLPPMKQFRWRVYKIPNYNSIDEFVSTPYVLDSRYTCLQNSKEFKFTTAP